MQIRFRKIHPDAIVPEYQTPGSAGLDLHARIPHEIHLWPGVRYTCPTGIAIELPEGFEGQVRPRSGMAIKHGVTLCNSVGTIDADFRGEICALLINLGSDPMTIEPGMRIAQLVIAPIIRAELVRHEDLSDTERGEGGFGHTGA
jgi:dUTP pyrophosphatase